ncbi:MAG: hypothetical protein O9327_02270 [Polaromonas sp.]|nr:hypothetical protein [Polaromonas sp.]
MARHPYSHITDDPAYFDVQADRLELWASREADPARRAVHQADANKARAAAANIREALAKAEAS